MWEIFKSHHKKGKQVTYNIDETVIVIEGEHWIRHHPRMVRLRIFNNQKYIVFMGDILKSTEKAPPVIGLVDSVDLTPIPGASAANVINTTDDATIAIIDADGNVKAVAPGQTNWNSQADWTYTDKNTQLVVTNTLKVVTPITVTQVVTAEGVTMIATLGDPIPQ